MTIRKKSIITSAMILTAASLISRVLGFVYRIYMTKAIGAEGIGLYQLIMPVYNLCWSISCAGITTTVSKLVASENAKREYGNMGRVLKQSLFLTVGIALAVSAVLFLFSPSIAFSLLKDGRTLMSLRLLSVAIPFMAAGSCVRGYFFGLQETAVPAVSQVFEQIVRMAAIYILASVFIPMGLEYACFMAVVGIVLGEFFSFLFVLASYRRFKSKNKLVKKPSMMAGQAFALIISMSLPLTLNKISGSVLSMLENLLIPQRLQMYGMTAKESISLFGQVTGMAMPLIFFPSALLVSLSIAIVPAVSEATAVGSKTRVSETISKSLMFTSVIGIFACMLFMTLPDELGNVIYGQDIGSLLFMLGLVCPLWYLGITLNGILNGLGQQLFIFRNSVMSSLINIGCIFFLVPYFGVRAFIAGWAGGLFVIALLSLARVKKLTNVRVKILRWFVKPAMAAAACGLTMEYISNKLIFAELGGVIGLIVSLATMAALYFMLILLLGCITISDIKKLYKRGSNTHNIKNVDTIQNHA